MKILLIIPAYNEEENIAETIKKIKEFSEEIEYIVINDGSKDNTQKVLEENNIKHIRLIRIIFLSKAECSLDSGIFKYAIWNTWNIPS